MAKASINSRPDIYLCGPMTDIAGSNIRAFANAAKNLSRLGYSVFNPGDLQEDHMSFEDYMKPELKILLNTKKALVALPGWDKGVGSRLEVMIATSIGLPVHAYSESNGLGARIIADETDSRESVKHLMYSSVVRHSSEEGAEDTPPHLEAANLVLGPRGAFYDHPYDNFQRTAFMWTGILYSKLREGETIDPDEVSLCLVALKMAREAFRHKRDNITDAHGYLLTHMMVLEKMEEIQKNAMGNGDSIPG